MYFICFTWNIAYFEINIDIYYIYFKDNYTYIPLITWKQSKDKDDVDNVVEYMRHREAYQDSAVIDETILLNGYTIEDNSIKRRSIVSVKSFM